MNANDRIAQGKTLLRLLLYGPAKTKKTWWACNAATANFNVILFDGDDGWHIINQIDFESRKRIQVVDVRDTHERATFCVAMTYLLKNYKLFWDDELRINQPLSTATERLTYIDLTLLDHRDLVIFDSWTQLVWSLVFKYSKENNIDLTDPEKADWDFYRWGGNMANWMLGQIKDLPCHLAVIGHGTMYEKRSKDGKKIEWQRQQLVSTSGPHAMTIAGKFSDILEFKVKGSVFKIDTTNDWDKEGGARNVPPGIYNWNDLQFVDVCKYANVKLPTPENRYLDFTCPAKPTKSAQTTKPVTIGGATKAQTTSIKIGKL